MDSRLLFGPGISIAFWFLRYRFPSMPRWAAAFGIGVGAGLVFWSAFPRIPAIPFAVGWILFAGLLFAGIDWLMDYKKTPPMLPGETPEQWRERNKDWLKGPDRPPPDPNFTGRFRTGVYIHPSATGNTIGSIEVHGGERAVDIAGSENKITSVLHYSKPSPRKKRKPKKPDGQ